MSSLETIQAALADRYQVERELGQGGMATVYLALDLKHHRKVAIKVLREDLAASMGASRFLREIEIAAQLQHPNILPLLDSGEANGLLYYVMPYVNGQSLRERIDREGELPVHEGARLIGEVVDALVEAHEHGVVHRDIKPDNVMLAGRHALVTDFGVAKAISEATGRNTVTTLGVAVGTPTYMSPEQAAADPHVDHRSDIYSVGVMAYEVLTGQPPFTGSTPQQVLAAHVTQEPQAITLRRPAIPPALEAVIMRCLAKRPADRWQTATELHAALEPFATPSVGITPTTTQPVRAVVARRVWRRVAVAVPVAVIAGLAWWWLVPGHRHGAGAASIAVLPFDNVSRDTAWDYLADGIANDVRDGLMKLPGLIVKARTSSAAAKGKSVHDAGQLLAVPVLLQGEYRRTADRVTVTVDLVKVSDESALWSHDFVLPADGNFAAAQDSITTAVEKALHLSAATGGAKGAVAQRGTNDVVAYDLYLKGMFFFAKRGKDNLFRAVDYFHQAIARDSNFARAYAGLAALESILPAYVQVNEDSVLTEAGTLARRALAIDSTLADAHLALADVLTDQLHPADAEPEFLAAIALDPRNVTAHQWHADNLNVLARVNDAVREGRAAVDLDPLSAVAWNDYSYVLICAGRFADGADAARRALELDPTFTHARMYLGEALAFEGHPDSAQRSFGELVQFDSTAPNAGSVRVLELALGGQWSQAEAKLATIAKLPPGGSRDLDLATGYVAVGNKDAAINALDRATSARSFYIASTALGCDPFLSTLKTDPRFITIVKRAGQAICIDTPKWPLPPRAGRAGI
ncbi:MAG: protein kinase domain-containing protein [Gemmatimonadales bacterium]